MEIERSTGGGVLGPYAVRKIRLHLIAQRPPFDRFCTAVYLRLSHHSDMLGLEPEIAGYHDLLGQFGAVRKTRDAADLAEQILKRWLEREQRHTAPQAAEPTDEPPPSGAPGNGTDSAPSPHRPSEGRQASADRSSSEPEQQAGDASRDGQGETRSPSDPAQDQSQRSDAANSGDAPGTGDTAHDGQSETGSSSDQDQDQPLRLDASDSDAAANRGATGGPPSGDASSGETQPVPGPSAAEPDPCSRGGCRESANAHGGGGLTLIGEALAEVMAECVASFHGQDHYRVYSKEHDRIEVVPAAGDTDVKDLLQTDTDTVRRLRRGLTNALRSAEKRWWREDETRGALSPRTLYRLCTDRTRLDIFRTRTKVQGKSTAVSVLLDASGSMSRMKMNVAKSAMRVLLEALGDLKIPTEALTFTTGRQVDIKEVCRESGLDANEVRGRFGRISNLEIGLIKRFDDPVKAALQRLPNVAGTGLTPLGEAMQVAAARLVPRPETRRILLVLSDGRPGCEGGASSALSHAQHVAKLITKSGIELVGVGILDDLVNTIIGDAVVIHQIEELPARLCKLLGRTLKKGVCCAG